MSTVKTSTSALRDRLTRETRAEVYSTAATGALRDRRQPLPDRADRRGRAPDGRRRRGGRPDRGRGGGADRPAGGGHQPLGADDRRGDRHRLLEVPEPDRRRRPRRDDRAGRAGRRARPAQRPPEAAGPDVRARRLDQRPGHDRRHDRQQLGRRPVAAVRQDRRSRPRRSTSSWPTARPRRSGPSRTTELDAICRRDDRVGRVHRDGPRHRGRAPRRRSSTRFPHILRRVSGYNLDEFVPGLPVRPVGWVDEPWQFNLARLIVGSEGTLAVVTGGRPEGRADPAGAGAGRPLVRHDPRGARPAGRDRGDRPGGRRDARPDDPRPGRRRTRCIRHYLELRRGPPRRRPGRPVLRRLARTSWPTRADDLARRFEGRPGVLGIRKSLTNAAKDDFWKVRKAGFSLLMAMVGDAKPIAFVEDTAVSPDRLPAFYDRFAAIVERHGVRRPPATATPTSAACTSGRSSTSRRTKGVEHAPVDRPRGLRPGRRVRRLDERRARRRPGPQPLEPQALRPRGLRGVRAGQARPSTPTTGSTPARSSATPDPGDHLRIGPEYHPHEPGRRRSSTSPARGASPAPSRCARASAPAARPATGTMCPSYMVTRDEMHSTRGRANALRLVMIGELPSHGDGLANETLHEALDLCLQCKACKSECPSQRRHGQAQGRVPPPVLPGRPVPARPPPDGPDLPAQPDRLGARPAGQLRRSRSPLFKWLLEKIAGIDRRRTLPTFARDHFRTLVPPASARPPGRAGGARSCCSTTASRPTTTPRSASRRCACWRRPATGSSWPACPAAAGRRSRRGCSTLGRDLARENVAKLAAPCPPGHADPRLRAELPGDAGRRVPRLPARPRRRRGRRGAARLVDAFVADPDACPT